MLMKQANVLNVHICIDQCDADGVLVIQGHPFALVKQLRRCLSESVKSSRSVACTTTNQATNY